MFIVRSALVLSMLLVCSVSSAEVSTIVEVDGRACTELTELRRQTESQAYNDARQKAVEFAAVHIESHTVISNALIEKDLLTAYSKGSVKILDVLEEGWHNDSAVGECYKVKIRAEVTPDEKDVTEAAQSDALLENPTAPLQVRIWTDRSEYMPGDQVKIYLKGNKPFHAKVMYEDAAGNIIQILPNPYRNLDYFNGGVTYEIPGAGDRFALNVKPPFGRERISVYASTGALGSLDLSPAGGVYVIKTRSADVGVRVRGIEITPMIDANESNVAEFCEAKAELVTKKQ